jgi:hypothetical protein
MADKQTDLEVFRTGLEDLVVVAESLANHCDKTKDLIDVLKLAIENDGQAKLLMKVIAGANKK